MNINAAFPSTYLKAADLQGRKVRIAIDQVKLEDVGGEHKPVLYFLDKDRGLVLNKTNGSIISELYGPETDEWHGKVITLYPARVEFQGKIVDAIRVALEPVTSAAVSAPVRTGYSEANPPPAGNPPVHTGNGYTQTRAATPRSAPVNAAPAASFADDEIPF